MKPLHEISDELTALETAMENEEDPEIIEASALVYFESKDELEKKIEGCGAYLINKDAEENALKIEIARLQARLKSHTNRKEKFREYVMAYMKRHNILKLPFPAFTVSIATSGGSVEFIKDECGVDLEPSPEFLTVVESIKIDKAAILKKLRAGEKLSFARLNKKDSLRIK